MAHYTSQNGFKESEILDSKIIYMDGFEKPWHVYFEYCIKGDKWSKEKNEKFSTEEEAKRMLEEFTKSFEEEKYRVEKHFSQVNGMIWAVVIIGGLLLLGIL